MHETAEQIGAFLRSHFTAQADSVEVHSDNGQHRVTVRPFGYGSEVEYVVTGPNSFMVTKCLKEEMRAPVIKLLQERLGLEERDAKHTQSDQRQ